MSKAVEKLREYVGRVNVELLSKDVNLSKEKEVLDEWKKQFKEIVLEVVKVIAEYSLFTSDEEKEKYDYYTTEEREKIAREFIKENIPLINEKFPENLMKKYFQVYLPEKDEIYEDYLKRPLTEISESFRNNDVEVEVVCLIRNILDNLYWQYKNKLGKSKVCKKIYIHHRVYINLEKWTGFASVTDEEKQYFSELQEKNISDMLNEYKAFVEKTKPTDQNFINQLVYAQMFLRENFLVQED